MTQKRTLTVDLGDRSYPIIVGRGLLQDGTDLARYLAGDQCLIVSNTTVGPIYEDRVKSLLPDRSVRTLQLPDGESHKTLATVQVILDELVAMGANRDATIIALGGGVVGDMAGFAAACYMRGIAFVQVPTTLLAQVDSSVGGKTGVNHESGKNLIGAFHQPVAVIIDTDTLATLPDRELSAGLAEVIKHGVIADAAYFQWLEENVAAIRARDADALVHAIHRSCEIKAGVVAEDERETGRRALLNFGHTFGHAIENSLGYGEWLHGEAVAAGMQMAAALSQLEPRKRERLRRLTEAAGLPVDPPPVGAAALRSAMRLDKKVSAKTLRFVLLNDIGDAFLSTDYSEPLLSDVLQSAAG